MEPTLHIPVPKQPRQPELTRDQRLRIQTLFFDAKFSRDEICLQTGFTYKQVCYALANRLTPQKRKWGEKLSLIPLKERG